MSTVTIRGVTHAASAANVLSQAITLPTCSAGDLLYLFLGNNLSTATPTTPSGWTSMTLSPQNVRTDNYGYLYTKTAVAGDSGATLTITLAAGTLVSIAAVALLATHDNLAGASKSTDGTSLTIPAVTPVAADCLELAFVSNCTRAGTDTPGMSMSSPWTEQSDTASTGATGNNIEVGVYTSQLTGQAGTAQATATVSVPGNAHSGLMYAVTAAPASAPAPSSVVYRIDTGGTLTPVTITPLT